MLHCVVEVTWYLLNSKIPVQTVLMHLGMKTFLGPNSVRYAAHRAPRSQEATQKHAGSEFPLTAMGFHSKNGRSNSSQIEWFLQQAMYESCRLMLSLHTLLIATNTAFKSNCHYLFRDVFSLTCVSEELA